MHAPPTDRVTGIVAPSTAIGYAETAWWQRSARSGRVSAVVPGAITPNSSPPSLARVSVGRSDAATRAVTWRSTSSPTGCP